MENKSANGLLDLPPKLRSWIPVDVSSRPSVLKAIESFVSWLSGLIRPSRTTGSFSASSPG